MKICIFHQPFDIDVSSGTDHARHQWHELVCAFGVTEMAVINQTKDEFGPVNDRVRVTEYRSLNAFFLGKRCVFVEQGPFPDHRGVRVPADHWIVFGGAQGLPLNLDGQYMTIPTRTSLYPRQAAAIILENQWAQSHS